ncbi:uncharacterized protein LOC124814332 [Hydra vulgaris]|uniref:uncharacterized protein LOC124814332 n=1 Tax=Hydra vulgaris TaxID=6087 RepID=UPI001F5EBF03|nr:uncharacterized protein LOC124814332 [Hydra vulgaris]
MSLFNIPFTVETDASDFAISATLNQDGRPAAFHSRTLQESEQYYSSVEKEAQVIVEAINHFLLGHFLLGLHFILITDQRSVAYMYDYKSSSKIKNDKIMRWRIALSPYSYDIDDRPGQCNSGPDTFTRVKCAAISLHAALCHPGVTRYHHFIRSRNFPYSVEDVKQICRDCRICKEIKPKYYRPNDVHLIKATQPFERISIDFKGPLPSSTPKQYMLTIVGEYSRFPFAYPVKDMTTQTIINCLAELFSMFGMPSYVYSDRGSSLMSSELKHWFLSKGIATSKTTLYNPTGNEQVERYNGIIWKAILLTLKSRNMPVSSWKRVLPDALHATRSLLCTSTNCSPHERFFNFQKRSSSGSLIPSWLVNPGPVLIKRNAMQSKYEDSVNEAQLIEANPHYAIVRFPNGHETTVSTKQLAPIGTTPIVQTSNDNLEIIAIDNYPLTPNGSNETPLVSKKELESRVNPIEQSTLAPRRSSRISKVPEKLNL